MEKNVSIHRLWAVALFSYIVMGCMVANSKHAADVNLAAWQNSPEVARQSWQFNALNWQNLHVPPRDGDPDPQEPVIPLAPDNVDQAWINSGGTPEMIQAEFRLGGLGGWRWYPMTGTWTRSGFYGGMGKTSLTFRIPQPGIKDPFSGTVRARVCWIYYSNLKENNCDLIAGRGIKGKKIIDTQGITWRLFVEKDVGGGGTGLWYRATATIEFNDIPEVIYIKVTSKTKTASLIDQVDVDTRIDMKAPTAS